MDTQKKSLLRCGKQREPLTSDFIQKLQAAFFKRKNFSLEIFLKRNHAPESLTKAILSKILSGELRTIAKSHKEFLEKFI
ncbi:MAG: hypothetical protein ACT4OY_08560 [Alphaproteobacteria bacterium]